MTAATCSWCGAAADPPPPTWSVSATDTKGMEWLCDRCTRENIRSIEGRLDSAWW